MQIKESDNTDFEKQKTELLLLEISLLREKLSFCRDCFSLYASYIKERHPVLHEEADGEPSLLLMSQKDVSV